MLTVLVFDSYRRPVIGQNICIDSATEDVPSTFAAGDHEIRVAFDTVDFVCERGDERIYV